MKTQDIRIILCKKLHTILLKNDTSNNSSNDIKAINLGLDLLQFIRDDIDLNINKNINYGEIFEIAYNHAHNNYITCKAPKGCKDTRNTYNTELKGLINCHSTIETSLEQLNNNKGYLILLSDGIIYQLDNTTILAHLNECRFIKNKYRLSNTFIKRYGKINKFQFNYR